VIEEREKFRVREWMQQIDPRQKTLVFCATQEHAAMVRDLINQNKTIPDPLYCVRVTANDGAKGEEYLRDFQDNEKTIPTILTTSQKLSTGVDARNVRNIVLMRPVNSMIEFKQIIGRGTRLYEGKDYFTILDFVKAYLHFSDREWDGEPVEPEPRTRHLTAGTDGLPPTVISDSIEPRPTKIKVKLADGKERQIKSMVATTFWSADGKPMSAAQFLESLFGTLPDFFRDEEQLRDLWSDPATRSRLLDGLAEKGFDRSALAEMQKLIEAEDSDLFDVLAYVSYTRAPMARMDRAILAKAGLNRAYRNNRELDFIEFVLDHYVDEGVDELSIEKLTPLLKLKYHAIADAAAELGTPEQIRSLFVGFQRFLYAKAV
jgi:type I restriction enzyme R subunit